MSRQTRLCSENTFLGLLFCPIRSLKGIKRSVSQLFTKRDLCKAVLELLYYIPAKKSKNLWQFDETSRKMPDVLLTMFDGIYLESVIHHAGVDPPAPQSPIRRREKWSSGDMASDNFNGFDF